MAEIIDNTEQEVELEQETEEQLNPQKQIEQEATVSFMRAMGVDPYEQQEEQSAEQQEEQSAEQQEEQSAEQQEEQSAEQQEVDVLKMLSAVYEQTQPAPEEPKDPRVAKRERIEEQKLNKELEATKRFLDVAGIDIKPRPEPKMPDVLQQLKESKDMIGMFQEVNGRENNPDIYYHQQEGSISDLLDGD